MASQLDVTLEPVDYEPSDYVLSVLDDLVTSYNIYTQNRSVDELRVRILAAASVVLSRAFTDTQLFYVETLPLPQPPKKRWRSRAGACPSCVELDGQEQDLEAQFDSNPPPAIYLNLLLPPRHINCRCYIDIVLTGSEMSYVKRSMQEPPGDYKYLTSDQIRIMTPAKYKAIVAWFRVTLRRLQRLASNVLR